jgi:hypothetical protein
MRLLQRHPTTALNKVGLAHKELPFSTLRAAKPVDIMDAQDFVLLDLRMRSVQAGATVRKEQLVRLGILHSAAGSLDGSVKPDDVEAADAIHPDVDLLDDVAVDLQGHTRLKGPFAFVSFDEFV